MGKKNRHQQRQHDELPSSAFDQLPNEESDHGDDGAGEANAGLKHDLYQRSVQTPRGEISYMLKFFLTYVGGRVPLHLREDFCGTALICTEWVRGDARRTAIGVDLDDDALAWGLKNNVYRARGDAADRVHLFHQNVLQPLGKSGKFFVLENEAPTCLERKEGRTIEIEEHEEDHHCHRDDEDEKSLLLSDIVCALNFSCCCLQERKDLVSYFRRALSSISKSGGVFVMDLYGGLSSEKSLRIRRRYRDFTYTWEQEEFDIVKRTTRISLHYQLADRKVLPYAFTYNWRLWTIPEVRDCLDEAGFDSTHLWLRERPEATNGLDEQGDFEEVESFKQCDAWNAYVVGVKRCI